MTFDELFHVFRLTEQCRKQTRPEGRRNFLMLFSLMDIRLFGYSISERARADPSQIGRGANNEFINGNGTPEKITE